MTTRASNDSCHENMKALESGEPERYDNLWTRSNNGERMGSITFHFIGPSGEIKWGAGNKGGGRKAKKIN